MAPSNASYVVEEKIDLATSMAQGLVLQNKPKGSGTSQESAGSGSLPVKGDPDASIDATDQPAMGPAASLISVLRATLSLIPTPPANIRKTTSASKGSSRSAAIKWEEQFKKKDARVAAAQVRLIFSINFH